MQAIFRVLYRPPRQQIQFEIPGTPISFEINDLRAPFKANRLEAQSTSQNTVHAEHLRFLFFKLTPPG